MSDHGHQLQIVDDLWLKLSAIDAGRDRAVRRSAARRRMLRTALVALAILLGAVAVALAARALLFGSPAPVTVPDNTSDIGRFIPGTVRLMSLRVPDPGGGPLWGMRVSATTHGYACVEAGRVVDGRLAALGVDGSFGDDGRAHALAVTSEGCGGLDADGHLRVGAAPSITTASATVGAPDCGTIEQRNTERGDIAALTGDLAHPPSPHFYSAAQRRAMRRALRRVRRELAHPRAMCRTADLRTVLLGVVGPAARAVTLSGPSQTPIHERLAPRDGGAYLFVLAGHPTLPTLRLTVRYRGGLTCPTPQPYARPVRNASLPVACRGIPPGYVYSSRPHGRYPYASKTTKVARP
jgi:hypothetical protein